VLSALYTTRASRHPSDLTIKHLNGKYQLRLRNPNMTEYKGDEAFSVNVEQEGA
jgi:hypothetical protein